MKNLTVSLVVALAVVLAACASRGGGMATEVEPGQIPAGLGDSLVALEMKNQNFEEALVTVGLPEGQTVRLGWIPGNDTRAWLVPMQVSGSMTFRIRLQAIEHEIGIEGQSRDIVRCQSRMHFAPGNYRTLVITEPVGTSGSFCPGANTSRE